MAGCTQASCKAVAAAAAVYPCTHARTCAPVLGRQHRPVVDELDEAQPAALPEAVHAGAQQRRKAHHALVPRTNAQEGRREGRDGREGVRGVRTSIRMQQGRETPLNQ